MVRCPVSSITAIVISEICTHELLYSLLFSFHMVVLHTTLQIDTRGRPHGNNVGSHSLISIESIPALPPFERIALPLPFPFNAWMIFYADVQQKQGRNITRRACNINHRCAQPHHTTRISRRSFSLDNNMWRMRVSMQQGTLTKSA
jgi:hypothetical protein